MRSLCGSTLLAAIVTLPTTVCAQDANRDLRKALRETTTGTLAARGDVYTPLIRAGQSMSGELSTDDTKLDNGSAFDRWVYEGSANERVEFTMTSGYANIVAIALEDNGKLVIIGGSDEARSASRIEIKLPQDGTYHVFAAGNGASALGPYTFSVKSYGSVANFDWARLYPGGGDPNAKYALLVGVSDYPGEASDLSGGPLLDVLLMKEVLVKRFGFKEENVLVLRDVEGNRDQVIEAFRRHLGQAGPNGTAVLDRKSVV